MNESTDKKALKIFNTICSMFKQNELNCTIEEEKLCVYSEFVGDDLNIPISFSVFPNFNTLQVSSLLPFKVNDNRIAEMAIAICKINSSIVNGTFDFDFESQGVYYRDCILYGDSLITENTIYSLANVAFNTIDEYNDKLLALNNGLITLEAMIDLINKSN